MSFIGAIIVGLYTAGFILAVILVSTNDWEDDDND